MNDEMSNIYMADVSSGTIRKTYILFDFDNETAKERARNKFRQDVKYKPKNTYCWKIGETWDGLETDPYELHDTLEVRE
jgi:hypothetical protein